MRYRRRWCVERLFAWLHFGRLVIRWEYHAENFLGMVQLGCIKILLRHEIGSNISVLSTKSKTLSGKGN